MVIKVDIFYILGNIYNDGCFRIVKIKIICILGFKFWEVFVLEKLFKVGMNVVCFNFFYGMYDY